MLRIIRELPSIFDKIVFEVANKAIAAIINIALSPNRTPTMSAIVWRDEFYSGLRIEQIAKRENLSARYVGRLINASLEVHCA